MNPSTAVLLNSPALNALNRKQLVSLCKRFHIKASGKNADLVAKLQTFAKTLPDAVADSPDSSTATHLAGNSTPYHSSSDDSETASSSPFKRPTMASSRVDESWSTLQEKDEEEVGTCIGTNSSRNVENERASSSVALSSPEPSVSRAMYPSVSREESAIQRNPTTPAADIEMDEEEFEVLAAVSPKKQTIRLPSMAFAASPIKRLSAATSLSTRSPIPGAFPSLTNHDVQSGKSDQSSFSPSPFVFGSPRHSVRNNAFMTPVLTAATSQTPGAVDAKLSSEATSVSVGLSMREIMEAELKKRVEEKASKGELVRGPGLLSSLTGISSLGRADGKKRRFDDAHEREFAKMTSIADHYAARRPGQSITLSSVSSSATLQKKSTAQRRPSSITHRPSLIVNSNGRAHRPKISPQASTEDDSGRAIKKTRFSVLEPVQVPNSDVSSESSTAAVQHAESIKRELGDKSEVEADIQRERERTRRKLAIAKARRSSLAAERGGRSSLASTPKTLPPKVNASRLVFLQTGMDAVKKGVSSLARSMPDSTISPSFTLQSPAKENSVTVAKGFRTLSSSTKPAPSSSAAAPKAASATLPNKSSSNASRAPIPTFNASSRSSSIRSGLAVSSTLHVPTNTPSISRSASRLFAPTASSLARQAGAKTPSTTLPSSSSSSSLAIRSKDPAALSSKRPTIPTMKRSPSGLLPQCQVQAQGNILPAAGDSTPRPISLYPTLPFDTAPSMLGTFPSHSSPNGLVSAPSVGLPDFYQSPSRDRLKAQPTARLSALQPRLAGSTPIRKKRSTMSAQSVGKPSGLSHRAIIASSVGSSGDGNGSTPSSARIMTGRKPRSSLSISVSAAKARARAQARARGRASVPNVGMSTSDTSVDANEAGGRSDRLSLAGV
ncbi:hypothetical protein [Phaffia rhodozyma]|uniref:SAP domain-containing protein n=1 Tax=Phaffia rhodozyma TaxID=264483 RepID=A0A0F7SVT1_PHARH|nr:hypothetical protein [Phaffia rhodozyma]